jgi:DNA repair exonuclease SbcCD ATPase subunit
MRLFSIILRHYRLHGELTVEFAPDLTVIGGPNECGKSTLVEAMHRALFLRAKTGGEIQKSMISCDGGSPEVELSFESGGQKYHLLKRFGGPSGTISLSSEENPAWTGEEAETRLAGLLGVETGGSGKGAANRALEQWAHLWVWQGQAAIDPMQHANVQCTSLLMHLQKEGGAAVMQSDLDARVAGEIEERCEATFMQNGNPRAGSDLGRAIAGQEAAEAAQRTSEEALRRLEQAVRNLRESERAVQDSMNAAGEIRRELDGVEAKLAQVASLRNLEQSQAPAATQNEERHEALLKAGERIRKLRQEIQERSDILQPAEAEMERLSTEESERRAIDGAAEQTLRVAVSDVREARLRNELATAYLQRFEKENQRNQLRKKMKEVAKVRDSIQKLEARLSGVPAIDAKGVKALQKLEVERSNAEAALKAMATGLEVLSADIPVKIGSAKLAVGDSHILTEAADLAIGVAVRLRIRPGGGLSLTEARENVDRALAKLLQKLDANGLRSVAEAVEAEGLRQQLSSEIKVAEGKLEGLNASEIDGDLGDCENALASVQAEIARKTALISEFKGPAELTAAQSLLKETAEKLGETEIQEERRREERELAAKKLEQTIQKLSAHRQKLQEAARAATDLQAQERMLIESHGDDATRAERLEDAKREWAEAERLLTATRQSLAELQPDQLERAAVRLRKSFDLQTSARIEAEKKIAVARSELQRDGTSDPYADLAISEERQRVAWEYRAGVERRAEAIRLLHALFQEQQKALSDQFTAPLAIRISSYLECIFGAGARAVVTMENNEFSGLRLIRPSNGGGVFDFTNLSGGTCEQVAAAVRLAMAEVLAVGSDGCLPLVFDDAFAYSDPERIKVLQQMLDLAAGRGLQIIVLSCNPVEYAGLGARQISLRSNGGKAPN